jgi:hypothetical protein
MLNEQESEKSSEFPKLIQGFVGRVESLKFTFITILDIIKLNQEKTDSQFYNFVEPFCSQEKTETELKISLKLPYHKISDFQKISKERLYHSLSSPTIKRNFIISLVSEFDIFLGNLLKLFFIINQKF